VVDRIALSGIALRLCMTQLLSRFSPGGGDSASIDGFCLAVQIDEKTGLFGKDGQPILAGDLSIGETLTVVGFVRLNGDDGELIPTRLPAETNGEGECDADDDAIDEDCPDEDDFDAVAMTAIVIEAGPLNTWMRLRGQVRSPVDDVTGLFDLFLFGGQGFPDDTVLMTQVYPTTRIYRIADDGRKEISAAELMTDDVATLDAVLIPGEVTTGGSPEDLLRAALMLTTPGVSIDPAPEPEVMKGEISQIMADENSLIVTTEGGDRCVDTDDETLIFEVFLVDEVFESVKVMLAELTEGNGVGVFGLDDGVNCFAADLIIAEGQRSEARESP
jgi:hypothetical protein